jgi:allophanate hydrolase subunit 1
VWAEVDDVVPAARTVLVIARDRRSISPHWHAPLTRQPPTRRSRTLSTDASHVEIAVRYDGPDLEDVARHTGLSPRDVVAAHTGMPWRVGFGGFAPGICLPRRGRPPADRPASALTTHCSPSRIGRARRGVQRRSIPRESPGGWQLIGTTDVAAVGHRPHATGPAHPGRRRDLCRGSGRDRHGDCTSSRQVRRPPSRTAGAAVRWPSEWVAQVRRISGIRARGSAPGQQHPECAAIEVTFGGLHVRAEGELLVCLTGAVSPAAVDGVSVGYAAPLPTPRRRGARPRAT